MREGKDGHNQLPLDGVTYQYDHGTNPENPNSRLELDTYHRNLTLQWASPATELFLEVGRNIDEGGRINGFGSFKYSFVEESIENKT